MNIQKTFKEKKPYVRPQITMIPMQAEHALLAASLLNYGEASGPPYDGFDPDDSLGIDY